MEKKLTLENVTLHNDGTMTAVACFGDYKIALSKEYMQEINPSNFSNSLKKQQLVLDAAQKDELYDACDRLMNKAWDKVNVELESALEKLNKEKVAPVANGLSEVLEIAPAVADDISQAAPEKFEEYPKEKKPAALEAIENIVKSPFFKAVVARLIVEAISLASNGLSDIPDITIKELAGAIAEHVSGAAEEASNEAIGKVSSIIEADAPVGLGGMINGVFDAIGQFAGSGADERIDEVVAVR